MKRRPSNKNIKPKDEASFNKHFCINHNIIWGKKVCRGGGLNTPLLVFAFLVNKKKHSNKKV